MLGASCSRGGSVKVRGRETAGGGGRCPPNRCLSGRQVNVQSYGGLIGHLLVGEVWVALFRHCRHRPFVGRGGVGGLVPTLPSSAICCMTFKFNSTHSYQFWRPMLFHGLQKCKLCVLGKFFSDCFHEGRQFPTVSKNCNVGSFSEPV